MKVALVTGSSEGIGFSIIENMLKNDYYSILISRKINKVNKAVKILKNKGYDKVFGLDCDVSKKEDRDKIFNFIKNKFNRLDCLVLNAAANPHFGNFLETNEKEFDKIYEVNLKAVFFMIKEYLTLMTVDNFPKNIVIISTYGAYEFKSITGTYVMLKRILTPLIKMLAKELRDKNIRVNGIAPGLIRTNFAKLLLIDEESTKEYLEIDKVGTTEHISNTVEFLISPKSEYINGTMIAVAGKPVIGL